MTHKILITATFVALLGSGVMAGVFFAFSTFVMRALGRLPAGAAIAAMQSVNIVVINPVFLGVFLGTAVMCVAAIVGAVMSWERPGAVCLLAGGLFYPLGTFLVTMLCNVPLNNALATVSQADPDAAQRWADYSRRWTVWNHVRTIAALAATASFAMAFNLKVFDL